MLHILLKHSEPIYKFKGCTRPVDDPESTVKLFELFRARYTELPAKRLL